MKIHVTLLTASIALSLCGPLSALQDPMTMSGSGPGKSPATSSSGGMMGAGGMEDMMKMMQTMHPAIAVDNTAIYIIRGDEILKLDKQTLQVIAQGTLPPKSTASSMGGGPAMQNTMDKLTAASPDQFDRVFLQEMAMHHATAVETSRLAVEKAVHPQLRQFAQKVIDNQSREISEFSNWLKTLYSVAGPARPQPMDPSIIQRLSSESGRQFEVDYMEYMIAHHSMALKMASMSEQRSTHAEVKNVSADILKNQSAEIKQLRDWLAEWYNIQMQ